jgi:hypothetical protein
MQLSVFGSGAPPVFWKLKWRGPMTAWLTLSVAFVAVLVSAQTAHPPATPGAALLVLPRSGVPISLEQIEERWRQGKDGGDSAEIKSQVCRDSAGRVRIDAEVRDGSGRSATRYAELIDPVAGSRVVLLTAEKIGYRTPFPKSDQSKFAFLGLGQSSWDSSHKWGPATTEAVGKRTIQGVGFEGTRFIRVAEGEPGLTDTNEQWYSDELKLIGLLTGSAPLERYSAHIQGLRPGEPDPAFFTIPAEYRIIDLQGR